jgi:hypothetical protein
MTRAIATRDARISSVQTFLRRADVAMTAGNYEKLAKMADDFTPYAGRELEGDDGALGKALGLIAIFLAGKVETALQGIALAKAIDINCQARVPIKRRMQANDTRLEALARICETTPDAGHAMTAARAIPVGEDCNMGCATRALIVRSERAHELPPKEAVKEADSAAYWYKELNRYAWTDEQLLRINKRLTKMFEVSIAMTARLPVKELVDSAHNYCASSSYPDWVGGEARALIKPAIDKIKNPEEAAKAAMDAYVIFYRTSPLYIDDLLFEKIAAIKDGGTRTALLKELIKYESLYSTRVRHRAERVLDDTRVARAQASRPTVEAFVERHRPRGNAEDAFVT